MSAFCLFVCHLFVVTVVVKDVTSLRTPTCDSPASVCGVLEYRPEAPENSISNPTFQRQSSSQTKFQDNFLEFRVCFYTRSWSQGSLQGLSSGVGNQHTISFLWLWVIPTLFLPCPLTALKGWGGITYGKIATAERGYFPAIIPSFSVINHYHREAKSMECH